MWPSKELHEAIILQLGMPIHQLKTDILFGNSCVTTQFATKRQVDPVVQFLRDLLRFELGTVPGQEALRVDCPVGRGQVRQIGVHTTENGRIGVEFRNAFVGSPGVQPFHASGVLQRYPLGANVLCEKVARHPKGYDGDRRNIYHQQRLARQSTTLVKDVFIHLIETVTRYDLYQNTRCRFMYLFRFDLSLELHRTY